jgi:propanediol dehydratase small subunit
VQQDDSAQQAAARKERLADAKAIGRSATILTDYALAMKSPSVLKPTLGA